jgi:ribosomal protein S27E
MSLANMREHGGRFVEATCEACKHEAAINVDTLPAGLYVPDVALRLRCSACGSKQITTRPDWTRHQAYGRGGYTTARNPRSL